MPIITKPSTIDKNSPAEISLDKAALAAVSSVVADDYFSDSDKALDIFEVQKIVIVDFDAGSITIPRSQLTTSEFDIDMSTVTPPVSSTYISYNINSYGYILSPTGGVTSGAVALGDDQFVKSSNNESTGDFDYQWSFNWTGVNAYNMFVGITTTGGSVWYNNLSCIEGTGVNIYRLWFGGSPISVTGSLSSGDHVFRLVRIGTTLYYYLDATLIHSGGSVSGTAQPTVRAYPSNVACTQSTVNIGDAIVWNVISNSYNAEADGGLTNGAGRGGSAYYNVYSNTQTVTAGGDIDITYNVGSFAHDTALGFISTEESTSSSATPTFCGIVSGFGDARPHINSVWVSSAGIDPSNKTFRITRISGVVTMYIDSVQIYTTSVATAPNIKPIASLATSGGTLISSSVII